MDDSQHLDAVGMDTIHEPILAYDELSNRRIVVLRDPATAFCENTEGPRGRGSLAYNCGGVRFRIARDVLSNGHKVIAGQA
ncbi:MAG: hypothetical protein H6Q33_2093 [Deltaproteobacteria bacterium]|nr:hypothetical protein [Deltaproteobacteria bacterium]